MISNDFWKERTDLEEFQSVSPSRQSLSLLLWEECSPSEHDAIQNSEDAFMFI